MRHRRSRTKQKTSLKGTKSSAYTESYKIQNKRGSNTYL